MPFWLRQQFATSTKTQGWESFPFSAISAEPPEQYFPRPVYASLAVYWLIRIHKVEVVAGKKEEKMGKVEVTGNKELSCSFSPFSIDRQT